MEKYKEWILLYLLIIFASFGSFALGIVLMAPCAN